MTFQRGMATVEFALVGPVALMVLLGCIEIGRMLFVWNTLVEATRRGARVAIVSNPATSAAEDAVLEYASALKDLTASKVAVVYLDATGTVTTTPANMRFVQVSVTGLTHSLLVPYVGQNITVPAFTTTLPVESLGVPPN